MELYVLKIFDILIFQKVNSTYKVYACLSSNI